MFFIVAADLHLSNSQQQQTGAPDCHISGPPLGAKRVLGTGKYYMTKKTQRFPCRRRVAKTSLPLNTREHRWLIGIIGNFITAFFGTGGDLPGEPGACVCVAECDSEAGLLVARQHCIVHRRQRQPRRVLARPGLFPCVRTYPCHTCSGQYRLYCNLKDGDAITVQQMRIPPDSDERFCIVHDAGMQHTKNIAMQGLLLRTVDLVGFRLFGKHTAA